MVFLIIAGLFFLFSFIGKSSKENANSKITNNNSNDNGSNVNNKQEAIAQPKKEIVPIINWHKEVTKDSVTGEVGDIIYNTSKNRVNFSFPYNVDGGSVLNLVFRKRKQGTDAYVVISKGQMICGYSDCSIRTKGDDGKLKKWAASSEASGRSDMIFIDNPKAFEKYIKKNKKVTIGVTFYQSGEQGFNFDVKDYPDLSQSKGG